MLNFSINNITKIRAYEDVRGNKQYLEIWYKDLDDNDKRFIYTPQVNQYNIQNYGIQFGTLLATLYSLFDYCDERNEFYKLIYRFNLEIMRRGHYFMDIIDNNQKYNISINMRDLENNVFIGDDIKLRIIRTDDGTFYGLDASNSEVVIPNTSITLYKEIEIITSNVIVDLFKDFEMCVLQLPNVRFIRDYNALQKNKNLILFVSAISTDDINSIKSLAENHPGVFINLIVDQELDYMDLDAKSELVNLSPYDNIHIYIKVDTQSMNITVDNVKEKINDIYSQYQSNVDGIFLDNIKILPDDADDSTKEEWEKYYIEIKKYCHNYITENNGSIRYYIIGRSEDNKIYPYLVSNYNNPTDLVISYKGNMPGSYETIGDPYYSKHSIAIIENYALPDSGYESILDNIFNIINGVYITSTDTNHPDWGNIEKITTFLENSYPHQIPVIPRPISVLIKTSNSE